MNGRSCLAGLAVSAHNNAALNTSTFTNVSLSSATFGIYRELWTNLNSSVGNTLAALTNTADNPNWPNNPVASYTHIFTNFETEINTGMNYYGQRLRTFVVPPPTASTRFGSPATILRSFILSTNENPAAHGCRLPPVSLTPRRTGPSSPASNRRHQPASRLPLLSGSADAARRWRRKPFRALAIARRDFRTADGNTNAWPIIHSPSFTASPP
jgi:hypothetical protein